MGKRRGKNVRKIRQKMKLRQEIEFEQSNIPFALVTCKDDANKDLKLLCQDFKKILEPHVLKNVRYKKQNSVNDFVKFAATNKIKNVIVFSDVKHSKTAPYSAYMKIIRVPHGPTFTFRLIDVGLCKDVQNLTEYNMNTAYYQNSPLLVIGGFEEDKMSNYEKSTAQIFQNLFPEINVTTRKVDSMKRGVFLNKEIHEKHGEILALRHYFMTLESKEIKKSIKKLGFGVNSRNTKLPDLSKYASFEDYLKESGQCSESEMSEVEGECFNLEQEIKNLPGIRGKVKLRLIELGPVINLVLVKIEEGIQDGAVLYHRYYNKSAKEMQELAEKSKQKTQMKEHRKLEQQKNVDKKKKEKEEKLESLRSKKKLISGMRELNEIKTELNKEEEEEVEADDEEESDQGEDIDDSDEEEEENKDTNIEFEDEYEITDEEDANEESFDEEEEEIVEESEEDEELSEENQEEENEGESEVEEEMEEEKILLDLDIDFQESESENETEVINKSKKRARKSSETANSYKKKKC